MTGPPDGYSSASLRLCARSLLHGSGLREHLDWEGVGSAWPGEVIVQGEQHLFAISCDFCGHPRVVETRRSHAKTRRREGGGAGDHRAMVVFVSVEGTTGAVILYPSRRLD